MTDSASQIPKILLQKLDELIVGFSASDDASRALEQLDARQNSSEPITTVDAGKLREKLVAATKNSPIQTARNELVSLRQSLANPALSGEKNVEQQDTKIEAKTVAPCEISTTELAAIVANVTAANAAIPVAESTVEIPDNAPPEETPIQARIIIPGQIIEDHEITLIKGIDDALAFKLEASGLASLFEISQWQSEDVIEVREMLKLGNRIARENWIEQAALLAHGTVTAHALTMGKTRPPAPVVEAPPPVELHSDSEKPKVESRPVQNATIQEPQNAQNKPETVPEIEPQPDPQSEPERKRPEMRRTTFADADRAAQASALVAEARARARTTTKRVGLLADPEPVEEAPQRNSGFQRTNTTTFKDALTGPRVSNTAAPMVDEAVVRIVRREPGQAPTPERLVQRIKHTPKPAEEPEDYAAYEAEVAEAEIRFVPAQTNKNEAPHASPAAESPHQQSDTKSSESYDRYLGALFGKSKRSKD